MLSTFLSAVLLAFGFTANTSFAQPALQDAWQGRWVAEGTLFSIDVEVQEGLLSVTPVESLGFEWTSEPATIDGNVVEVEVNYISGGVTGVIRAELLDDSTGILTVKTCMPDFMVSCLLSKVGQAILKKVAAPE